MAAARKQIVATIPATTGLASPSSEISVGGKGSERGDTLQSMKHDGSMAANSHAVIHTAANKATTLFNSNKPLAFISHPDLY